MNEQKIQPVGGLHLAVENGKTVLKNICNEVGITILFAEEEPARNAKEACLSIIGRRYSDRKLYLLPVRSGRNRINRRISRPDTMDFR